MIDRSSSSMRVYWRDVETLARKQRHQLKMAALASRIFWLNFRAVGGSGDAQPICIYVNGYGDIYHEEKKSRTFRRV